MTRTRPQSIRATAPNATLSCRVVDLADLDSVRALAAGIVADGVDIDVLMNKAGVMMPPRRPHSTRERDTVRG